VHHGRERDRSARFDHQLQFGKGKSDGRSNLIVAHRYARAHQRLIDRKS